MTNAVRKSVVAVVLPEVAAVPRHGPKGNPHGKKKKKKAKKKSKKQTKERAALKSFGLTVAKKKKQIGDTFSSGGFSPS